MRRPLLLLCLVSPAAAQPFAIEVIDAATKKPVPVIRVETVSHVGDYTDNAGLIAFDEPGLMDQEVWFNVSGHGYEVKADGFGYRGVKLRPNSGGEATIEVTRLNLAERIQRLTGAGRFVNAAKLGRPLPGKGPLLAAQVLGCDSVDTAISKGKMFWLWGDTNRASYPLGNFSTTAAFSPLPGQPGCRPETPIDYDYFKADDGFVKGVARFPGDGPTWLGGLVTLKDHEGNEHLCATYAKVKPSMEAYERGLCEFDFEKNEFRKVITFAQGATLYPDGHAFRSEGKLYFGQATPQISLEDSYEAWKDIGTYQSVTCDIAFTDASTGKPVKAHNGSLSWNPWRKKWVSIFTDAGKLGQIRYAEAPTPTGPWRKSIVIADHEHYTFYNPLQHPEFASEGGRVIWFEGTLTMTFSGNPEPIPRHDYNQVLYRIDLGDPRLEAGH